MLNVRLDKDTEKKLKDYSDMHNQSKSSVVKEALAHYFTKDEAAQSPFFLGSDLFGAAGSGDSQASVTYKSKLKQKLNEKHSH